MKKFVTVILLAAMVLTLAGCENATANVSNKNSMLFKVGKTTYTKGQLYSSMVKDDAANTVVSQALEMIANAEVETTAEIQAEADEIFEDYKKQIQEASPDTAFEEAVKTYGFETTEELRNYCLTTAKSAELKNLYIDENWDALILEHYPVKARVMFFNGSSGNEEAKSRADAALAKLQAGASFTEVAAQYSDTQSLAAEKLYTRKDESVDVNVLQFLLAATTPSLSQIITNQDSNGFYIVQVTNVNRSQLKDEFTELLNNDTSFADTVTAHYFKKHSFTVYDINLYTSIYKNYPAYLVQSTGPHAAKK